MLSIFQEMKVKHTLIFILSIIAVLAVLVIVFPKDGIRITDDFVLYFPSVDDFLPKSDVDTTPIANVDSIVMNQVDVDELLPEFKEKPDPTSNVMISDNAENYDLEAIKSSITPIDFPDGEHTALDNFFNKLSSHGEYEKIRVLHYGDSQIEGDRITANIRNKLQGRFGGFGVGMCSPTPVYAQYSMKQENSDNWIRFSGFGKRDPQITHKKYGPMIAFSRFTPVRDSLWERPEAPVVAWLKFYKSTLGYANTRQFKNVYVYYGNVTEEVKVKVTSNGAVLAEERMPAGEGLNVYSYKSSTYMDEITFEFEAYDSPDFYAVSFEDDKGIYVDNIAMRGSSGTVFATTDRSLLSQSYSRLGADLFILQFGGNAIPCIKDLKGAKAFVNHFASQLRVIKSMCPKASILVVGPSDMSVKIKDEYETYPMLDTVVTELRNVTLQNNCAYWDIYKAMGGHNSMPQWVNAEPALAAPDYTHFSPQGAYIISNMLYNALIVEYTNYLQRK